MSLEKRSARRVDRWLDRLRDRYGPVDVEETTWHVDREEYEATRERFEAGAVGGAGAWVVRGGDRGPAALMVRHRGDGWSEPAGKHEPGETLAETAVRETREETGVDCSVTGLLRAERAVHVCQALDSDPLHRLVVVFSADYEGGEARAREEKIADVGWFAEHPEDLLYPGVADLPIT